ncbi:MAG: conserved exported protein of unknown function [Nitrospira sp.]|nr:MAG: conserved exported protein of unknown function [Nitrospira sp.]
MKRGTFSLAFAMAAVYLTLSFSAASCLFSHQTTSSTTHHHPSSAAHASLCAWACQANPTVDLLSTAPQTEMLRVIARLVLVATGLFSLLTQQPAHSRAPPRR